MKLLEICDNCKNKIAVIKVGNKNLCNFCYQDFDTKDDLISEGYEGEL